MNAFNIWPNEVLAQSMPAKLAVATSQPSLKSAAPVQAAATAHS